MILDYNAQKQFTRQLQLDDIGNVGLICSSDEGYEYYLALKTVMGKVMEVKAGPIIPDVEFIPDGYAMFYRTFQYKEPIILKEINSFINDPRKKITDIEVKEPYDIIDLLPNNDLLLKGENDGN